MDKKGAFLLAGAGLTIQGHGDGGAVMQQAANGAFWQELELGGRSILPPARSPRGRERGDWPARPGAGPGGPVPRGRLKRAQESAERTGDPARAQSAPAPARWVLGIAGSLWLPRLYKLLDLTCLCNPHFHSMSPCSCASNR